MSEDKTSGNKNSKNDKNNKNNDVTVLFAQLACVIARKSSEICSLEKRNAELSQKIEELESNAKKTANLTGMTLLARISKLEERARELEQRECELVAENERLQGAAELLASRLADKEMKEEEEPEWKSWRFGDRLAHADGMPNFEVVKSGSRNNGNVLVASRRCSDNYHCFEVKALSEVYDLGWRPLPPPPKID